MDVRADLFLYFLSFGFPTMLPFFKPLHVRCPLLGIVNVNFEPLGKQVGDGGAHPVASTHAVLVRALAEVGPGVEFVEQHLRRRNFPFRATRAS